MKIKVAYVTLTPDICEIDPNVECVRDVDTVSHKRDHIVFVAHDYSHYAYKSDRVWEYCVVWEDV